MTHNRRGIYIWTDASNGMQYVGWSVDMNRRIKRHYKCTRSCPYFHASLAKRPDQFSVLMIDYPNLTSEQLKVLEISYIKALGTNMPNGYNMTEGGDGITGYRHTQEFKQKLSKDRKGIPKPKSVRLAVAESNRRRTQSAETRKKIGDSLKGRIHTEETKQKISESQKGDKHHMKLHNRQERDGIKQLTLFDYSDGE